MAPRTPVYLVASPRPRVGKTLLARLLVDFCRTDKGTARAFDLNTNEPSLVDYLPEFTAMAEIDDTLGEMALLDRLVVNDSVPKIVDLSAALFERFFRLIDEIDLPREAHLLGVEPVVMFATDQDRSSARAYATLQGRFPDLPIVPVHNEAIGSIYLDPNIFPVAENAAAVRITALPTVLRGVIDKPGFSFKAFASKSLDQRTPLHAWMEETFLAFREMEVKLALKRRLSVGA